MYTQNDINKILADVNRVLANMDERITELEKESKAKKPTTPTSKTASSK